MQTWKEFFKAVMSRKFAIAFIGITSLYLIARSGSFSIPIEGAEGIVLSAEQVELPSDLYFWIKAGAMAGTVLIVIFTVWCQYVLDLKKKETANPALDEQDPEPPATPDNQE